MRKKYKVQGVGENQYRVTIPVMWARHHGLKPGDEVWVEFSDGPKLTITIIEEEPGNKEE